MLRAIDSSAPGDWTVVFGRDSSDEVK
ncbi:hypothetical protein [Rhizobium leguminosarum]|nr:hypothetical protein [Rhizobium leguminosarum]